MKMEEHVTKVHARRKRRENAGLTFQEIIREEVKDLHAKVNEERSALGKSEVELLEVLRIDETCAGHVDYALKLGIRLQALVER